MAEPRAPQGPTRGPTARDGRGPFPGGPLGKRGPSKESAVQAVGGPPMKLVGPVARGPEHGLWSQVVLALAVLALLVALGLWLRWPAAGGGPVYEMNVRGDDER